MACTNCTQTTATITGFIPSTCTDSATCAMDAGCIIYTGPNLSCSSINTNDALDTILQKIDPLLCAATGDYSTYNTFCLAPITTQKEFVESISNYVCTLRDDFDTFVGTTYATYVSTTNGRLTALEVPGVTCASTGVINTDTLIQILNKQCTKFTAIDAALNVSGANWTQCYSVSPLPTTPTEGFDTVLDQICLLKAQFEAGGGAPLPTFNNVGSCLPTPLSTSDTLVDTVNKIKTRLCQTGTLNTTTLSWGCVTTPTGAQNLQDSLQNILTKITAIAQALPLEWSADFDVTNVDDGDLCLGKSIALNPISFTDRLVAATAGDLTPGVLQSKLTAGTNISLDYVTTPGQVIINSSAGVGTGDHKVASDAGDTAADYLSLKLAIGTPSNGIQVYPSLDATNHVVRLNVSVDPAALMQAILDEISDNPDLAASFCAAIVNCPSPCDAPTNVTVTYTGGPTTTTTTTTTSTTTTTTTTL